MGSSSKGSPATVMLGGLILFGLIFYNMIKDDPPSSAPLASETTRVNVVEQKKEVPTLTEQIKALGGNEIYLSTDASILTQCGITDIRNAELINDTGEPTNIKAYRIVYDENRVLTMTFEKGSLYYLGFNGTDLYTTTDGVIMKMQDVHIPETDIPFSYGAQLQMICEDVIKKYLNFPLTADFHTLEWAFGREDNNYIVQGSVTASNAFGVREKMPFTVWLEHDPDADEMTPTGVSLNGSIVYNK